MLKPFDVVIFDAGHYMVMRERDYQGDTMRPRYVVRASISGNPIGASTYDARQAVSWARRYDREFRQVF